jgi:hypothetical protein
MPRDQEEARLLEALEALVMRVDSSDAQLLVELQKCPSSRRACALLFAALDRVGQGRKQEEFLGPPAGWIHPFI